MPPLPTLCKKYINRGGKNSFPSNKIGNIICTPPVYITNNIDVTRSNISNNIRISQIISNHESIIKIGGNETYMGTYCDKNDAINAIPPAINNIITIIENTGTTITSTITQQINDSIIIKNCYRPNGIIYIVVFKDIYGLLQNKTLQPINNGYKNKY